MLSRTVKRPVYVTALGLQKLSAELDYLRTAKRQELARRLHEAIENGGLEENADYELAKNDQAFVEGRILELQHMLAQAEVIPPEEVDDQEIRIGSTVVVQQDGSGLETYTIVGAAEANPKEGRISNESPLGQTLLGRRPGDAVQVRAPDGTLQFRVVALV